MLKFPGKPPPSLGLHDGRLAPCPGSANCVCSQRQADAPDERAAQHIQPFKFAGDPFEAMTRLVAVLLQRRDARIVSQTREYLHAEFEKRLLGMIDDVECLLSPGERVIHLRSASRQPWPDFGISRARLEELREAFDDAD